jgi:cytochrome c553
MSRLVYVSVLIALLSYCGKKPEGNSEEKADSSGEVLTDMDKKAFRLLSTQCFSCHSPEADPENRIAPPMVAIRRRYMESSDTKEEFISSMVSFVQAPSKEQSRMPGAIRKFNLMPMLGFAEEDIALVAEYIYETPMSSPAWFEEHYEKEHGNSQMQSDPVAFGRNVALSTKSQLGKNLLGAIQARGTEGALEFCNTRALPLTDSMSQIHHVQIQRVSDRPRNPENRANENELKHIQSFKDMVANQQTTSPILEELDGEVHFYMPIMTNNMCMQCHGQQVDQVKPGTLAKIATLYPTDEATGYDENQVRGIWSITWDKIQ